MQTQVERAGVDTVAARFRTYLESGQTGRLAELYAPDAMFDANLPSWRLQRQGAGAILKQFEEWYPTPPRYLEWLERTTPWGAVVQCAELDGAGADEVYIRSVCLFLLEGERIVEHITYCTGGWDAAARERHEREAPMVQGERSMR